MRISGSQRHETLTEAGYNIAGRDGDEVILADDSGKLEVWIANDHHSGYAIEINGTGHEFCRDF
jgi:hypothetical protein